MGRNICHPNSCGENSFMIFTETKLNGAFVIEVKKLEDKRGFFARSWDDEIFREKALNTHLVQCNISFSKKKGTLRGMHYQESPFQEAKLVRCTKGKIFDVIVDLRQNSLTENEWFGIELSESNHKMLYVPEGFAHGFQSLEDNTEIFYQVSQKYMPKYERGKRWDDRTFKIPWPILPPILSDKDANLEV